MSDDRVGRKSSNRSRMPLSLLELRVPTILAATVILLAVAAIVFSREGLGSSRGIQVSLPLAATSLALFVSFWFGRSQGRYEAGTVRIAVGGAPGSGKTVFVNVLMNVLMEADDSGLRFTPETRTAAAAIQSARRLAINQWPTPTSEQGIYRYSGSLERGGSSGIREFLGLASDVRLELADNAGELWQQLSNQASQSEFEVEMSTLTSSNFFEYLTNAHSLLYFVSAEDILAGPARLRVVVEDAISAFKLVVATRGTSRRGRAVRAALVISKADLLSDDQLNVINRLVGGHGEFSYDETFGSAVDLAGESDFGDSVRVLERLVAVFSGRSDDYYGFVVSSVAAALEARIVDDQFLEFNNIHNGVLVRRARQAVKVSIRGTHIADPIRWTLSGYWRDRRSGRISA
jgi:hypothetical protein